MSITTKQNGNAVTITLDGEQFEILQRVADALNTLTWDNDRDNTPETVCREWVGWMIHDDFDPPSQFAEGVVDSIETHAHGDAELDAARRAEVRRAFEDAGLLEKRESVTVAADAGAVQVEAESDAVPVAGEDAACQVNLEISLCLARRIEKCAERWGVGVEDAAARLLKLAATP